MTQYTNAYDTLFQQAAATQFRDLPDWRWLKAQCVCESNLDPDVTAADGGMGIAQFMPDTWGSVTAQMYRKALFTTSVYDPAWAIPAQAYYLHSLWAQWTAPRPWQDRLRLSFGAYNCGMQNMLLAQKASGGANDAGSILTALAHVTGTANAGITCRYVHRIFDVYDELNV